MPRRSTVTDLDVFTPDEVFYAAHLLRKRAAAGSDVDRLTLLVWNLSCCCGLRASEIAGVRIGDVLLLTRGRYRPNLYIPAHVAKRGGGTESARRVPLTWVPWLLDDLRAWLDVRRGIVPAGDGDPLAVRLSGVWKGRKVWAPGRASRQLLPDRQLRGSPLDRQAVRDLFVRACRVADLKGRRWTTHTGRHTFVTHALAAGFPAANVRDAAGHQSLSTTSLYAHAVDGAKLDGKLYAGEGGAA